MIRNVLIILSIVIVITPVYGKEYQSSFGFTIDIPEHSLVLPRQELKENPDLFDFDKKDWGKIDKKNLKDLTNKVTPGDVEFYFNQKTSDGIFADNINAMKGIGKIPENNTQLLEACQSAPKEFSSYFGKKMQFYQCKLVNINNLKSLFLEYDGIGEGTRNIQYIIQKSPGVQIIITATCKNSVLETIRKEFTEIVLSIRM
jgi:hypothetical protein